MWDTVAGELRAFKGEKRVFACLDFLARTDTSASSRLSKEATDLSSSVDKDLWRKVKCFCKKSSCPYFDEKGITVSDPKSLALNSAQLIRCQGAPGGVYRKAIRPHACHVACVHAYLDKKKGGAEGWSAGPNVKLTAEQVEEAIDLQHQLHTLKALHYQTVPPGEGYELFVICPDCRWYQAPSRTEMVMEAHLPRNAASGSNRAEAFIEGLQKRVDSLQESLHNELSFLIT